MGQLFKTTKKPVKKKVKAEKYRKVEPSEDDAEENPLDQLNDDEDYYEEEEFEGEESEEDEDEEDEEDEVKEKKRKKSSIRTLVVKELPVQQVRKVKLEDGTWVKCVTIEEALTQLMNEE